MAKESLKAREVKRAKMVAKYAAKRAELKKIINTGSEYTDEKEAAVKALQQLPPNSNPQPLQIDGPSKGLHAPIRYFSY